MIPSCRAILQTLQKGLRSGRRPRRLGLLCNQTSFCSDTGGYLFELLHRQGLLARLFLPEHGLFAELQDQVPLSDPSVYGDLLPPSQVEIVSLYGETEDSLMVGADRLGDLDAILADIQDVGSRYYTFATTLSYLFDRLKEHPQPPEIIVLDRPNPAGRLIEGTILPDGYASFVGRPGLPHRHGLTIGELSLFYRYTTGSECPLTILATDLPLREDMDSLLAQQGRASNQIHIQPAMPEELRSWEQRASTVPDNRANTQTWDISPSPNMPGPITPLVYSGQCLLEGTNLSEGRGTTRPFELFGAPWLQQERVFDPSTRTELIEAGALLRPVKFIPAFHKYKNEITNGFQLHVTEPHRYHSLRHSLRIIRWVREHHQEFQWRRGAYEFRSDRPAIELLSGDSGLLAYLQGETGIEELDARLEAGESYWIEEVQKYRIYSEPLRRSSW